MNAVKRIVSVSQHKKKTECPGDHSALFINRFTLSSADYFEFGTIRWRVLFQMAVAAAAPRSRRLLRLVGVTVLSETQDTAQYTQDGSKARTRT